MPELQSDAWLIRESFSDSTYFEVLFERHYEAVHRFIGRQVGPDRTDDLAQDTFVEAWDHRDRYDQDRPNARPWLFGIAHNLVLAEYRRAGRQTVAYALVAASTEITVDVSSDVDDRLAAMSIRTLVRDAIFALPDTERASLILVAVGALSYADAAKELGVPVGTVKTRTMRAKRRIRQTLDALGVKELP